MSYPIYGFSASESGSFAVITSEKNYRTAVYVYDSYARQIYKRLLSDTYIDQVALSPDGNTFLALGHYAKNGSLISVLQLYSLHEEEPVFTAAYSGELPLRVGYLSGESFAVLTGEALRFYRSGEEEPFSTISMTSETLQGCSFSGEKLILTFSSPDLSGGTIVRVYDEHAELILSVHLNGAAEDKAIYGDALCLLTMEEVTIAPLSGEEPTVYPSGKDALQLLCDADGHLILFEKSTAYRLDTESTEPS